MSSAMDTTWGSPLIVGKHGHLNERKGRAPDPIEQELCAFLRKQIHEWQPDLIIAVERRGTAVLRALKESAENALEWPWAKVISSAVLDQLGPDSLDHGRIVVLDDMQRGGRHIHRVLNILKGMGPTGTQLKHVRVCVFAMHEDATSKCRFPTYGASRSWFYRGLTTAAYMKKRLAILSMLQRSGSLMLDTEHLEVRIRLRGSFPDFLEALSRAAHTIVFHSLAGRRNVTVYYEDNDPAHELAEDRLPRRSQVTGIVKKCRVVERGGDEFAVIPMCYPAISEEASAEWARSPQLVGLLGESLRKSPAARFYGAALVAGLEVLRWVLKSLYAAKPELVNVYLPQVASADSEGKGCSVNHLKVMYPTVDLERLAREIAAVDADASREGGGLRGRAARSNPPLQARDEELRKDAWSLLQVIRHVLDNRACEERLSDRDWEVPHPFGLTAREILELGDRFGWPRVRTSALFDILIDDGHLVTHATPESGDNGALRWTRVFQPDGEMVSELVRLYTVQRGLPHGF